MNQPTWQTMTPGEYERIVESLGHPLTWPPHHERLPGADSSMINHEYAVSFERSRD